MDINVTKDALIDDVNPFTKAVTAEDDVRQFLLKSLPILGFTVFAYVTSIAFFPNIARALPSFSLPKLTSEPINESVVVDWVKKTSPVDESRPLRRASVGEPIATYSPVQFSLVFERELKVSKSDN